MLLRDRVQDDRHFRHDALHNDGRWMVSAIPKAPTFDHAAYDPGNSKDTQMVFDDVRTRDGSVESFHQGDFGLVRPEVGDMSSGQDTYTNGSHVEEQLGDGWCWREYKTK